MTDLTLETINAMPAAEFVAALGAIYERSPWVAEAVVSRRPFASLAALHEAMGAAIEQAGEAQQRALLGAHPDLAGKAARAGTITDDSKLEQGSAGLDRLNDDELETIQKLNAAYASKFGFPFVICVRRHSKDSIFRQLERRLSNDAVQEMRTALAEVRRIGALRVDAHIRAADRLAVHGRLSTHVLDTCNGRPAQGVTFELHELSSRGAGRMVARGVTNADGRSDAALISGRPVPIGAYELRFAIGAYFQGCGIALADPPFLDVVPLRFSVAEPEGHYHVPLVASPWSYATYRGS